LEKRFNEYLSGKGSFYTKYNKPIKVVYREDFDSLLDAQKEKNKSKDGLEGKKEALIVSSLELLKKL